MFLPRFQLQLRFSAREVSQVDTGFGGALLDVKAFLQSAKTVTGVTPDRVTTTAMMSTRKRSVPNSAARFAIGQTVISITGLNKTIAASRADADRCWD
jgi:hypothetical protein